MNTMSVSRLGGVCLLGGGILGFIPFVLQIMVGGPPEEVANVYSYFAQNVIAGGSESLAYALVTSFAVALVAFGVYTLNGLMQEKETDAFLGLGTFLFVFGQVGLVIGHCYRLRCRQCTTGNRDIHERNELVLHFWNNGLDRRSNIFPGII